jgi:hypothetical protein
LWLLAIPFYPTRCIICGEAKWSAVDGPSVGDMLGGLKSLGSGIPMSDKHLGYLILIGTILGLLLIGYLTGNVRWK